MALNLAIAVGTPYTDLDRAVMNHIISWVKRRHRCSISSYWRHNKVSIRSRIITDYIVEIILDENRLSIYCGGFSSLGRVFDISYTETIVEYANPDLFYLIESTLNNGIATIDKMVTLVYCKFLGNLQLLFIKYLLPIIIYHWLVAISAVRSGSC